MNFSAKASVATRFANPNSSPAHPIGRSDGQTAAGAGGGCVAQAQVRGRARPGAAAWPAARAPGRKPRGQLLGRRRGPQ
jgi:hypothetical protein